MGLRTATPLPIRPVTDDRESDFTRSVVFVVGAECSGTHLLQSVLDAHPLLAMEDEFDYAVELLEKRFDSAERLLEYLWSNPVFMRRGYRTGTGLSPAELVHSFLVQKQQQDGKLLVGAVVHRRFDRLLRVWPDARFIHLVRDGRDVSRSLVATGGEGNTWTASRRWLHAEQTWDRLMDHLPERRRLELDYRELILDTESAARRVCRFLDLPFDPVMLGACGAAFGQDPSSAALSRPSRRDIRWSEARLAPMLIRRGYRLSGLPVMRVNDAVDRLLRLHSRAALAWRFVQQGAIAMLMPEAAGLAGGWLKGNARLHADSYGS